MPKPTAPDVALLTLWGARIARARTALGLTQKELAAQTGLGEEKGYKTLSNWENGHAPPTPWFLVKFHQVYGVDPNYILCDRMDGLPGHIAEKLRGLVVNK